MWQEEEEKKPIADSSDMAELSFSVDCKELPYDHAYELSSEILNLVPEIKNDNRNAIQTLHGPMSGNGWVRPDSENIPLSKRARLIMRINKNQINDIKIILEKSNLNFEILNLKFKEFSNLIENINEEKKEVTYNQKSNMSNIHQSLILSREVCEDLTYFVEDDYIHEKNSLAEMLFAYEKIASLTKKELIICPTDYPFLYNQNESTKIFLGDKKHWRQIDQTLCTFLTSKEIIDRYWDQIISMCKFEHYPFEKPLHNIYKKELCISPIPSLAVHFTNINSIYGLSPNVDWKRLWNENSS